MNNFVIWTSISNLSLLNIIIRVIAIVCILIWYIYWLVNEERADSARAKTRYIPMNIRIVKRMQIFLLDGITIIQLLGLHVFPFHYSIQVQVNGLILVVLGLSIGIAGRKELDTNWVNAHEYQIKKNQELITSGVYKYIRHPIYAGITLRAVGAQIVANSLLFIPLAVIGLIVNYIQAKKEEKLLLYHFGKKYVEYMKKTKMFLPYVF